ncbi:MAG: FHA domain-containing protein [Actinobacteria bacterium]|nr:MAG: FHA domain-containing protein [Actinomycetota bacterium]
MTKTNKCIECSFENKLEDEKCAKCGTELKATCDESTATLTSISAADTKETEIDVSAILEDEEAVLVVKKGPIVGQRMPLSNGETLIGRDPKCDIFLNDITVSRRHAKLAFNSETKKASVKDIGSLNGTYVNNQRSDESDLNSGDEVQIGKFVLVYLSK